MRPLILREGQRVDVDHIDKTAAHALTRMGVVSMTADASGRLVVQTGAKVGVVAVDDLQVVILPKVDIGRLVFMMSYARRPNFWRDDLVHVDPQDDFIEVLARSFIDASRRALAQGVLKGYVTIDAALPLMRGKIREGDQLRRHFGRSIPLEVRFDEYSVDIAENQLLVLAAERLLKVSGLPRWARGPLQRLRLQLAEVSPPPLEDELPAWSPSRLNVRYQPALAVAELILAGQSFEQQVGEARINGFLLDMARIFEDFITVALRESFQRFGGVSRAQFRTYLDDERAIPMRPDFIWEECGVPRVVVDAKYKAEQPSGFPNADFYQLLAYATVLGLPEGHLIYAKGNEEAREHHVRLAGTRLVAHAVDLQAEPQVLLQSIEDLVGSLRPLQLSGTMR